MFQYPSIFFLNDFTCCFDSCVYLNKPLVFIPLYCLCAASVELSFPTTPECSLMSCNETKVLQHFHRQPSAPAPLQQVPVEFWLKNRTGHHRVGLFLPPLGSDVNTPQLVCFPARLHRRLNKACAWKLMRSHQNRRGEHKDIRRSNSLSGCV